MPTSDDAAELTAAVQALGESVDALTDKTRLQEQTIARQEQTIAQQKTLVARLKRGLIWLKGSVIFDIILSVLLFLLGWWLSQVQSVQRDVVELNQKSQCAEFGLFFQSEDSVASSSTRTDEEKANAEVFFAEMHRISDELGCDIP